MVAPIRDLANIHFSSTTISFIHLNLCLSLNMEIVMAPTREKIPEGSKNTSRELSISSTISSKPYYKCMEI